MSLEENFTYLQKVALKGEIAYALSTCAHDAELKYRSYLILKEVNPKYRGIIMECLKEAITLNESDLDRIYLEVIHNTVPLWLWIEQSIADIKFSTLSPEGMIRLAPISINRAKERKNVIESAFIMFVRKAALVSPKCAKKLLEEILNDYDLEFLHNACIYLRDASDEVAQLHSETTISEKIMHCVFDLKEIMSLTVETKALSALESFNSFNANEKEIEPKIIHEKIIIDKNATYQEISEHISNKIFELFENNVSHEDKPETTYVVKKIFTDSGLSIDLRTCKTEKEATDFIKNIIKKYPNLTNTCEFRVQTERVNDKEKNKETRKNT